MKLLLSILFIFILAACSSKEATDDEIVVHAEIPKASEADKEEKADVKSEKAETKEKGKEKSSVAKVEEKPEEKEKEKTEEEEEFEPSRELGSLWSDESHWNRMFSVRSYRKKGDTILVKPTEIFRNKMSAEVAKVVENERAVAQFDQRSFVGFIRRVDQGGIYRVEGTQNLRYGAEQVSVKVTGLLRENEIADDESVSSDSLHEVKMTVSKDSQTKEDKERKEKKEEKAKSEKKAKENAKKKKVVKKTKKYRAKKEARKRRAIKNFEKKSGRKVAKKTETEEEKSDD